MRAARRAIAFAAAGWLGVSCVPPPPARSPVEADLVVESTPPAPLPEAMADPPWPGAVWLGGFWGWDGVHFVWSTGRWAEPRPGWRWEPHHWERRGGRWRFVAGRWTAGG